MKGIVKNINHFLSEHYFLRFHYKPSILCFLMHKIYPSRSDVKPENGTVSEGITKAQFETFVLFFKRRDFKFIDETDILSGNLNPQDKYVYLTFDDGYYNNFSAVEILNKYKAKATFYITTNHCKEGKNYWWDVLYKNRTLQNHSREEIDKEVKHFYTLHWKEQEDILFRKFGADAIRPDNDLMRPMNPEELKRFAENKSVCLGNHTHNHLNLSIYSSHEIKDSLQEARNFLGSVTDQKINSIAYPYGLFTDATIDVISSLDYAIGHTCIAHKNYLDDLQMFRFRRISVSGFFDIEAQCRNHYMNFSLFHHLKNKLKN